MDIKLKSYLLLVGTLVIGLVLGFLLTTFIVRHRVEAIREHGPDPVNLGRLMHHLDLNADQKTKIKPLLESIKEKSRTLREQHISEQMAVRDSIIENIIPLLNETQKLEFDEMRDQLKQRNKRHDR